MPQNFQVFAWDRRSRLSRFPNFPECRFADYPDSRIFRSVVPCRSSSRIFRSVVLQIIRIPGFSTIRPYGRAMVKEGKGDKTVAFSKSDGTAISFKASVTRSKQPTNNYLRHARKSGRMTVSAGAKKPKKTGGNFVRKPPTPEK